MAAVRSWQIMRRGYKYRFSVDGLGDIVGRYVGPAPEGKIVIATTEGKRVVVQATKVFRTESVK